jgi:hypothetical protein
MPISSAALQQAAGGDLEPHRARSDARGRLQTPRRHWLLEKYMMWTVTEWLFGKQRREFLIDPLLFASKKVHWRNYEAGYDVAELEPVSRTERTYVLQEYFVPIRRFDEFVPLMADILKRHRVNVVNVSVRHSLADPGSMLAWAREECFAFVLYYKQRTRDTAKARVGVWTRELVEAAIACGGSYISLSGACDGGSVPSRLSPCARPSR